MAKNLFKFVVGMDFALLVSILSKDYNGAFWFYKFRNINYLYGFQSIPKGLNTNHSLILTRYWKNKTYMSSLIGIK